MPESAGLRARKKQRTRRDIEQAALSLFEDRGFDGTTIDDIAAAADIAPRTFFHYFPSKDDVVLADYATRLERILLELQTTPADRPPWLALRGALLTVAADFEAEREQILRRFRIIESTQSVAARNLLLQASWEDAVTEAISDRLGIDVSSDIRPRLIASAAIAAMRTSIRHWLSDGGQSRLPDHIAHCFDLLQASFDDVDRPT